MVHPLICDTETDREKSRQTRTENSKECYIILPSVFELLWHLIIGAELFGKMY